jgi:hypothetical protein
MPRPSFRPLCISVNKSTIHLVRQSLMPNLLLHAIHSLSIGGLLKKTILNSGFKNLQNKKTESTCE